MDSVIYFEREYALHGLDGTQTTPPMDEATAEVLSRPFQAVFEQYFQELSHRRLDNSPTD